MYARIATRYVLALWSFALFQDRCLNTEEHIKNVAKYFISSGLAKLGYTQINIGMLVLSYFSASTQHSAFPKAARAV